MFTLLAHVCAQVDLPGFDPAHPTCWLKLNPGVTGFFRVHYGEKLFEMLLNHIQDEALRAVDRMAIFDDQVQLQWHSCVYRTSIFFPP